MGGRRALHRAQQLRRRQCYADNVRLAAGRQVDRLNSIRFRFIVFFFFLSFVGATTTRPAEKVLKYTLSAIAIAILLTPTETKPVQNDRPTTGFGSDRRVSERGKIQFRTLAIWFLRSFFFFFGFVLVDLPRYYNTTVIVCGSCDFFLETYLETRDTYFSAYHSRRFGYCRGNVMRIPLQYPGTSCYLTIV